MVHINSTEVFGADDDKAIYVRPYSKSRNMDITMLHETDDNEIVMRFSEKWQAMELIEAIRQAAQVAWPEGDPDD